MRNKIFILLTILMLTGLVSALNDTNTTTIKINGLAPLNFPALVSVNFIVITDVNNASFFWDFGDGKQETTSTNIVRHIYQDIGEYILTVSINGQNSEGSQVFVVNAGSPQSFINKTITDDKNYLANFQNQLSEMPELLKEKINSKIDFSELDNQLNEQENEYASASSDSDYLFVMQQIQALKIPVSVNITRTINTMPLVFSEEQFDSAVVEELTGKEISFSDVSKWFFSSIDGEVESKTYSVYYTDNSEEKYSDVKVYLKPKDNTDKIFFIVNGNSDEVVFSEEAKKITGNSAYLEIESISDEKTIEFLYPDRINPFNVPIIIASAEDIITNPTGSCNNNGKCDENENYKSCEDCKKPWTSTFIGWFILFLIAFLVYIILQEWYKRYYEKSLFKNRNDLFNLVNYMNNSVNQGIKKSEIFDNLKKMKWFGEQLTYAWNKLNGSRTGMWEIPLFKWLENRQVRNELEKRKRQSGNIRPSV